MVPKSNGRAVEPDARDESTEMLTREGSPRLGFTCQELTHYFDTQVVPMAEQLGLMDGLPYVDFIEKLAGKDYVGPESQRFSFAHSLIFGYKPGAEFIAQAKARFALDAMCVGVLRVAKGDAPTVNRDSVLKLEGFLEALIESKTFSESVTARNARAAASERHRENRDMKRLVFTWLSAHRVEYKSMDAAAEAIAGKVVPISVRTARSWVSEWHKEQA